MLPEVKTVNVIMVPVPSNAAEAVAPEPVPESVILTVKDPVKTTGEVTEEIAVINPFEIVAVAVAPEPPPPVNETTGALR